MSGIFGWYDYQTDSDTQNTIIKNIISALGSDIQSSEGIADSNFAIYACGDNTCFARHTEKNVFVAVSGAVRIGQGAYEKNSADVILIAYLKDGIDCIKQLRGSFSIILIDKNADAMFVSIDRMGVQPLSYSQFKYNGLMAASNNDALVAHPAVQDDLNSQEIFNYTYFHIIPSPNTIYKDVGKLEPAQLLSYKNSSVQCQRYWTPDFNDISNKSIDTLKDELDSSFNKIVSRYEINDTTGAFLSGGLDSSTVSGYLAKQSDTPLNVFSIGFAADGYDEIEYARIAAKKFNLNLHEYYITTDDIIESIPKVAKAYDEPFGNSSAIPTLICAKFAASNGVNTLFAGDGGDELFAGNERYATQKLFSLYSLLPKPIRNNLLETGLTKSLLTSNKLSNKIYRFIEHASTPMPARMQNYNFMNMFDPATMFEGDFLSDINIQAPIEGTETTYKEANTDSLLNKMLYLDWKLTLSDNDLRKVNKMCELANVNVKYPMMDDDLVEFSTHIHPSTKLKRLKLRYFYKYAMNDFLPKEIINKPKHGFGLPFGEWLKTSPQLQNSIYDTLLNLSSRGIFQKAFIDDLIERHRTGHASYYGTMVWVLSMLEHWFVAHNK